MRFLLSLALTAACAAAAHASTIINDFTYTYVLAGNTYVTTFSLADGQVADLPNGNPNVLGNTYKNVALNGNAASTASVTLTPATISQTGHQPPVFSGLVFELATDLLPGTFDIGLGMDLNAIRTYSAYRLTFNPGLYAFSQGSVFVGTAALNFDSSSLAIAQRVLADPPPTPVPTPAPVAVTPEPGTLSLLGTGLLAVGAAARRRLSQPQGA